MIAQTIDIKVDTAVFLEKLRKAIDLSDGCEAELKALCEAVEESLQRLEDALRIE